MLLFYMPTINPALLYSQIDVFLTFPAPETDDNQKTLVPDTGHSKQLCGLIQELVSVQDRQAAMMEQLVALMAAGHRQRIVELGLWKLSNPELALYCKKAAKKLERVHNDLLSTITDQVDSNSDSFFESEYGLTDFLDKYGSKLMQLDMMLHILRQLGNAPDIKVQTNEVPK
ncbi:MAG: hypothetical protein LBT46_12910 [Planctomycetaceae bacterium]|jgi:hypothetical protein|nr:hypothetical protein [Planctomycetaceae bacterium]